MKKTLIPESAINSIKRSYCNPDAIIKKVACVFNVASASEDVIFIAPDIKKDFAFGHTGESQLHIDNAEHDANKVRQRDGFVKANLEEFDKKFTAGGLRVVHYYSHAIIISVDAINSKLHLPKIIEISSYEYSRIKDIVAQEREKFKVRLEKYYERYGNGAIKSRTFYIN